jgi:hypothetical protein
VQRRLLAALLVVLAAGAAVGGWLAASGGGDAAARPVAGAELTAATRLCEAEVSERMVEHCYVRKLVDIVAASRDPATELPRIDRFAHRARGYLEERCHILMHAVGRAYGERVGLRLADLQDVLPRSNDPSCSAGFSHGLVTYLGPQVYEVGPEGALALCDSTDTRYERYSCVHGLGHAYARTYDDQLPLALASCRKLGAVAPDCAQGAFHDYWFSLAGADGTRPRRGAVTSPRALCARQAPRFVRPCWYRAYIETAPPIAVRPGRSLARLCAGLAGLQRAGCVTAGSVVAAEDPFAQARGCARLAAVDALACVRGVRAQALAGAPLERQVALAATCARFPGSAAGGCYEWLGRVLTVVTDGRFAKDGCSALAGAAARRCARGAARLDQPLETFS